MRFGVIATILLLSSIFVAHATLYEMRIEVDTFNPQELVINVHDEVKFASYAGNRRIIFDDGFKTGFLSAGTSLTKKFDNAGTVTFQIEGEPEITGQVEIVTSGAPPPVGIFDIDNPPQGEVVFVAVNDYEFLPIEIEVNLGDTVVWTNIGQNAHSVDFYDDPFEKGVVNADRTYNRTFTKPGEYAYRCRFHNAMKGVIKVVDSGVSSSEEATGLAAQTWEQPTDGFEHDITIEDFAYDSAWIDIKVGDSVTWYNTGDAPHTVMAKDGSFDTGDIPPSTSATHLFTLPGIYEYTCSYHPEMKGTVVVNVAGSSKDDLGGDEFAEDPLDVYEEPFVETPAPVITAPVVGDVPDAFAQGLDDLRKEIRQQLSSGGLSGNLQTNIDSVDDKVTKVQAQIESLATGLGDVQRNVQDVEQLARNPPKIEMPATAPPVMVYVSLALDILLLMIILGIGVYLLRKPSGSKMSAPPVSKGVSSVVKPKKGLNGGMKKPVTSKIETSKNYDKGISKKDLPQHDPLKDATITSKQPESSDPTQIYIKRCREKGLTDEQIITRFKKSGWSDEKAQKAVNGK